MTEAQGPTDESPSGWATTPLEIAVAILVTATVVFAVLWVGRGQTQLRQSDAELSLAYAACQSQLEALRRVPFAQLEAVDGSGFDVLGPDGAPGGLRPMADDGDGLPGQFTVTIDKASGDVVLYRVTAIVAWQGTLRDQTFELETLMGARR